MAGRPHALADPEYAKQVAELFAEGLSRTQMCEILKVKDPDTITRWRRDPRVKAHALKIIEDRVLQVTRKVDASIAARLENPDQLTIKDLLDIRKEFLGGALRMQTEKADDATVAEAQEALEANPDLIEKFEEFLAENSPAAKA